MILIVGGTGDLGGRVVQLVRDQGREVRCLVRAGTEDAHLRRRGVEIVRGDLTDPNSLLPACEGVATVVATATAIGRRLAGAKRPTIHEVDHVGMSALIDAAERAGVARFVYLSVVRRRGCGPWHADRARQGGNRIAAAEIALASGDNPT
jgi:uncharacterized protein YbjT (DUF2867 family)